MKSLRILAALILFYSVMNAQKLEIWKNYTNTNYIRAIAVQGENLWAVTSGGLFNYNLNTKKTSTFTKSENLSTQDLTALAIDRNGLVWVGSSEGYINVVDPSDGSIRKIFDIYNSSRTQKGINSFTISGDTLYVSHGFGLSLINTSNFGFMDNVVKFGSMQTESKVLSISKFSSIYACLIDGIAIQKTGAVDLYAPDSWNSYSSSGLKVIKAVFFNNELFLATNNGLYKFASNTFTPFLFTGEPIVDLKINSSSLYILTAAKLYKYTTSSSDVYTAQQSGQLLTSVAFGSSNIYISSNKGVVEIASSGTTAITTDSPLTNTFMNVDVDSGGNLWAATGKDGFGKGIMMFNGSSWTNFYTAGISNDYHNVYAGTDNNIYWMNWGNGFSIYANNQVSTYNTTNSIMLGIKDNPAFLVISDIKNDSKGNAWILNFWPVDKTLLYSKSSANTWTPYNFPSLTGGQIFYKLAIDKYDTKWITVSANITGGNKGLIAFNESATTPRYQYYSVADGLNSESVNAITVDLRGYLWIGTSIGLNYIPDTSNPRIYSISYNTGIKYQYVTAIEVDALDQKWVGTKAGLFVLSSDCITQLAHYDVTNSPLPSNEITSLAVDRKNGIAYIGTDYGLSVLKTDFVEPKESFGELITFPSPYIVGDGRNIQLKIDGLVKESSIKILSIRGELINEFRTSGGRIGFWDGKDQNGNFVATGVYFLIAFDQEGNNVAKGRIAVIKK